MRREGGRGIVLVERRGEGVVALENQYFMYYIILEKNYLKKLDCFLNYLDQMNVTLRVATRTAT